MSKFEGTYHYVPNGFVYLWEKAGWEALSALDGTGHGLYSTLMKWGGESEPVFPTKEEEFGLANEPCNLFAAAS